MPRPPRFVFLAALALAATGCASDPTPPALDLEHALYPDLAELSEDGIAATFRTDLRLRPPISGGLVWLNERADASDPTVDDAHLAAYYRAGVLDEALAALRRAPFEAVASLPPPPELEQAESSPETLERLRSASAHFQYDVAFLLETGTAEERGVNAFALGYLGLVTAPLFPGTDLAASASAELCAVDVRTGIMLGCAHGRAEESSRSLFIWQVDRARKRLLERTLRESVAEAATDLLIQISARVASL
jgi:hypothetical protein